MLKCTMSKNSFFLDPFGDILPCNGTAEKKVMGNLKEKTFDEIWNSPQANKLRDELKSCDKKCWMISNAIAAMKEKPFPSIWWVAKHKLKGKYCLEENEFIKRESCAH